jgi:uncharacterized membrane protein YfcA
VDKALEVVADLAKMAVTKLLKSELWAVWTAMAVDWLVAHSPLPPEIAISLMGLVTALAGWYVSARTSAKKEEAKLKAAAIAGALPGDPP